MIVIDTHVLVWWASDVARLSAAARRAIDRSLKDGPFLVSAISIFEIATAIRRGRLELTMPADQWLADLAALPEVAFEPVTVDIAQSAGRLSDDFPGDPADRIIVSTALCRGARLVTADPRLRGTRGVSVVW